MMCVIGTRKLKLVLMRASRLCGERLHLSRNYSYPYEGLEVAALPDLFPGFASMICCNKIPGASPDLGMPACRRRRQETAEYLEELGHADYGRPTSCTKRPHTPPERDPEVPSTSCRLDFNPPPSVTTAQDRRSGDSRRRPSADPLRPECIAIHERYPPRRRARAHKHTAGRCQRPSRRAPTP